MDEIIQAHIDDELGEMEDGEEIGIVEEAGKVDESGSPEEITAGEPGDIEVPPDGLNPGEVKTAGIDMRMVTVMNGRMAGEEDAEGIGSPGRSEGNLL